MDKVKFRAFVARDDISDEYYPRTYLFDGKPSREPIVYWGTFHKSVTWDHPNGKVASYKLKELLPELKHSDEPVEVEVTVKVIKKK